jgi:hypothetical protein
VLLLRHPDLVGTVDRFRTGARRDIDARAWEELTHREIESVLVMAAAREREETREIERRNRVNANGSDQGHS